MLWFDRFQDIQSQVETQPNHRLYAQLRSIVDTFGTKTVFRSPQANGFHYLWAAVLLYEVMISMEEYEEARELVSFAFLGGCSFFWEAKTCRNRWKRH